MADLLQEVDEVMRQERMEKFWQENKNYIIGFIVGTILLTGILSGYRSWDANVKAEQTATIMALQDAENYPQNLVDADLNLRAGLRGMAIMQAAATALGEDDQETALKLYERAAADIKLPKDIRQSAIIGAVNLKLNAEEAPDANALLQQLQIIIQDANSPWTAHANILSAVVLAHLNKDYDQALKQLEAASKIENLPQSLSTRINALGHVYTMNKNNASETE